MIDFVYEVFESLDSTNNYIKQKAREGAKEGLVATAYTQTAGRGRVGRSWECAYKENLATSALLRPYDISISSVPTITIVCGLAVRDVLQKEFNINAQIKWPNDIVVNGKKICGILVEMDACQNIANFVVPGIGINIHQTSFSEEIAYKATSIDMELMRLYQVSTVEEAYSKLDEFREKSFSEKVDKSREGISFEKADKTQEDLSFVKVDKSREDFLFTQASKEEIICFLMKRVWENFSIYYDKFKETSDLTAFIDEYEAFLVNKDNRVRIEQADSSYEAIARGIDKKGALIIEVDGLQSKIESGEVSVRGVYGYT